MASESFARHMHGDIALDICWDCRAIWFDKLESAQLSPAAVIALFRRIHEHRDQLTQAYGDTMRCPRCNATLELTNDRLRNNRLRYHRCPNGHGRLTAFMQFLREKEFVRTLSPAEIDALKATVTQVRCSSCGAIIDVQKDAACGYCKAPLAILDANAVDKALATLSETDRKRTQPNTEEITAAFASMFTTRTSIPREPGWTAAGGSRSPAPDVVDLVVAGISFLFDKRT